MRRRLLSGLLVGALAGSFCVAAPAAAAGSGPSLVLPILASMLPGQQGWLSALWISSGDICNVKITASGGSSLGVDYPTNTDTFTSFYINSALAHGNMDYSAIKFDIPDNALLAQIVTLKVSWVQMKNDSFKKTDDLRTKKFTCTGTADSDTVLATIPIGLNLGAAATQETTTASIARGTPAWVKLTYSGTKPGLANFRVKLTPPTGLTVAYPGGATSAGLNDNTALPVGGEDYASVYLDASKLAAGVHKIPVSATWTGGSLAGNLSLTVT
ncbi:hypothetical protein GCM10010123_20610 [Pilimelia anulata]|uniref:Uncharacterized protein n=1 Tax=Pilimelia anulata TaxID=53371 RepID=A0A8J3F8Z7_9ACTN|nr:hypothetical protein [Pilimelia anulata]GGJ90626.1 hypothetical protein GCM10010123_20610 [Pilimelia anulata]